jgi:hypothetical protein
MGSTAPMVLGCKYGGQLRLQVLQMLDKFKTALNLSTQLGIAPQA